MKFTLCYLSECRLNVILYVKNGWRSFCLLICLIMRTVYCYDIAVTVLRISHDMIGCKFIVCVLFS